MEPVGCSKTRGLGGTLVLPSPLSELEHIHIHMIFISYEDCSHAALLDLFKSELKRFHCDLVLRPIFTLG